MNKRQFKKVFKKLKKEWPEERLFGQKIGTPQIVIGCEVFNMVPGSFSYDCGSIDK